MTRQHGDIAAPLPQERQLDQARAEALQKPHRHVVRHDLAVQTRLERRELFEPGLRLQHQVSNVDIPGLHGPRDHEGLGLTKGVRRRIDVNLDLRQFGNLERERDHERSGHGHAPLGQHRLGVLRYARGDHHVEAFGELHPVATPDRATQYEGVRRQRHVDAHHFVGAFGATDLLHGFTATPPV